MRSVELQAEIRSGSGKEKARALRKSGKCPAVFYGPKREAVSIAFDSREFFLKISSLEGSHLIKLTSTSSELSDKMTLIKETQLHPVSGAVLHADFYEVDMTAKLRVPVPLHFVGKPEGVILGGILQPVRREIEVECLPTDIPEYIEVDVTALNIHDAVHVSQLTVPQGVTAVFDEDDDFAVVTVVPPTVEAPAGAAAEEAAAAPAEGEAPKAEGDAAKDS